MTILSYWLTAIFLHWCAANAFADDALSQVFNNAKKLTINGDVENPSVMFAVNRHLSLITTIPYLMNDIQKTVDYFARTRDDRGYADLPDSLRPKITIQISKSDGEHQVDVYPGGNVVVDKHQLFEYAEYNPLAHLEALLERLGAASEDHSL